YLASAIPFFFIGILFSVVFARYPSHIPRLYGADLTGGALACLATVPLLEHIGGPNTVLFSAGIMAVAAVIWTSERAWRIAAYGLAVVFTGLIAINSSSSHPLIDVIYAKGRLIDPATVEYTHWNSISRVEVKRRPDGSRRIFIDADATTVLMNVDAKNLTPQDRNWLMDEVPSLANALRPHGQFAIIGPGGGPDVVRAVASGSPKVTGIEINPIIVTQIMQGRYADYSHHLYELPEVDIHVSDGRSFVRSSSDSYDVVQMTLVDTWASTAAGAFALSENNLYTVQAFEEYFRHLHDDGMIAITRWEFRQPREALRVVSVAMEALHRLGVPNPGRNFIVASQGPLNEDGIAVVVLAKKTAFTPEEESAVEAHFEQYHQLAPIYLPSQLAKAQTAPNPFADLIASNDPYRFGQSYAYNVAPVSDNAPFFFFTLKPGQILQQGRQHGIDWKVNLGVLVLILVLVISLAAVLGFLILPLALQTGRQSPLPLIYFVAVGLGYILVEIAFIQRFVLFLGHPTYALTVVIFLLMLSSGAGSLLSRRWLPRTELVWMPLVLVIITLCADVFFLPRVLP